MCYVPWSLLSEWKEETVTCKGCVMVRGLFYASERKRSWHVKDVLWSMLSFKWVKGRDWHVKDVLWSMVSFEWKEETVTCKGCAMVRGLFHASERKRPWHAKDVLWSMVSFMRVKGRDCDMWRMCYGPWSLLSEWKEETDTGKGCAMVLGLLYAMKGWDCDM
jgi:ribosomal protein S27E